MLAIYHYTIRVPIPFHCTPLQQSMWLIITCIWNLSNHKLYFSQPL